MVTAAFVALTACGGGGGGDSAALPLGPIIANPGGPAPGPAEPGNPGNPGNPNPPDPGVPASASYTVSLLAGSETGGVGDADGTGAYARFDCPSAIFQGPNNVLFVGDGPEIGKKRIRSITQGTVATKFASDVGNVAGIAIDAAGKYFLSSLDNDYVTSVTADGKTEAKLAAKEFQGVGGLAMAKDGSLIVADTAGSKIKLLDPVTSTVTPFVGSIYGDRDGAGSNAQFSTPYGIAIDAATGEMFVADYSNNKIRHISPLGEVTTFAGSGANGHADGQGKNARFDKPSGVAIGPKGDIYVSDQGSHTIRRITRAGEVTTIAGKPFTQGAANGKGNVSTFSNPTALAVNDAGMIFVADCTNNQIRSIVGP